MNFIRKLSLEGFGFAPERIWVTVFAGNEALGLETPTPRRSRMWLGDRHPGGAERAPAAL